METACPVIVCDICGTPTPARFLPHGGHPAVTEEQRADDLRAQGWTLTPHRDRCPSCGDL